MNIKADRLLKALRKKARKGDQGYPIATIAFYGPNDRLAKKVVVGIIAQRGSFPVLRKRYAEQDARNEADILQAVLTCILGASPASVAILDQILGCPHEEGIDYPVNQDSPNCACWAGQGHWPDLPS